MRTVIIFGALAIARPRLPWIGGALVALLAGATFASEGSNKGEIRQAIEVRAACITHEGADLPTVTTTTAVAAAKPQIQMACSTMELDATVCDAFEGTQAQACRSREIAIWDGVLDRLSSARSTAPRLTATKNAIVSFRIYRDRTCAAYRAVALNPSDPSTVEACRLSETARFTQRFYDAVFSP